MEQAALIIANQIVIMRALRRNFGQKTELYKSLSVQMKASRMAIGLPQPQRDGPGRGRALRGR